MDNRPTGGSWAPDGIHNYNLIIPLNSTLFFDVRLISLKISRVAHPVSGILGETLPYQ